MATAPEDRSVAPPARVAGALWLATVACGLFAEALVRGRLVVDNDPAATAQNILASQSLFRFGLAADLLGDLTYAGASLILYAIFRSSSRALAGAQLWFAFGGCVILAANLPALYGPLILLTRLAPLGGMGAPSLDLLAIGALKSYSIAYNVSLLFFAIQVALLGLLILRSRLFPKLFGFLFLIEACCNAAYALSVLVAPAAAARMYPYILMPGLPAEAGFAGWLLLFGMTPIGPRRAKAFA